jgi:Ca2+-transporting ATPase
MARFTRHVAIAVIGVIAVIAVFEGLRGATAANIFLLAVALAVSAIPEGLRVAMTVALSIAMHRMGLRHVVVRHLPAVEGLGACTVIATDKTGTLTLNRLSVERIWLSGSGDTTPSDPSGALAARSGRARQRAARWQWCASAVTLSISPSSPVPTPMNGVLMRLCWPGAL